MCWSNLGGGENGNFCVDGTQKIGSCNLGVYEEGDCAAYGANCSEAGGSAHCVHFLCWTNLNGGEDGRFCREGDRAGNCALGVYTETACAASGLVCRTGECVAPGSDVAVPDADSDAATGVSADAGVDPGADGGAATDVGDVPVVEVDAGSQSQFDAGAAASAEAVEPAAAERVVVGWHEGCCATAAAPTPWLLALLVGFGWRRRLW
jgi:hypothetical protein